jgi:hypothetical protein
MTYRERFQSICKDNNINGIPLLLGVLIGVLLQSVYYRWTLLHIGVVFLTCTALTVGLIALLALKR